MEFYLLEKPNDFDGTINNLKKGAFIGTDYDFMFNPKLRQTIFDSCLEHDSLLINFYPYERMDPSIANVLNSDVRDRPPIRQVEDLSLESQLRNNPALLVVHQGFIDTKNYMHLGMICGAYRIFGLTSMLIAFNVIATYQLKSSLHAINIYSLLIPVFVVFYDQQLPRINGKKEHAIFKYLKFVYIGLYYIQILILLLSYFNGPIK